MGDIGKSRWRRQAGLSLIELMVAMLLAGLLMAGMIQIFLASKVSYMTQGRQAYLHESGRFALEFMARDARMAGLLGCASRNVPTPENILNNSVFEFDFSTGLRGYEFTGTAPADLYNLPSSNPAPTGNGGLWTPTLPASIAAAAIPGSDVLVIRQVGDSPVSVVSVGNPQGQSGAQFFVNDATTLSVGDILMVTDCQQATVFQATNVSTSGNHSVVGSQGANVSPGNSRNLTVRGPEANFQPGAEVVQVRTAVYFVGTGPDGPVLRRAVLGRTGNTAALGAPEDLIGGVESMQLLFGVDTSGNFSTDAYVPASGVTDWNRVVAVRIALLLRTPEEYGPQVDTEVYPVAGTLINPVNDRRQRRVFSKTIALRNRML
jgi:type IV pilus assembly protein PilW